MTGESPPDGVAIGSWSREWGIIVPAGNPDDVESLGDLVDRDLRFVNRTTDSGLRSTLSDSIADLAAERGVERRALTDDIDGFEFAVRAHESPARKVLSGAADAGLGLRLTAESLGMAFVPCGTERVSVIADPDRAEKPAVERLEAAIGDGDAVFAGLVGYGAE